MSCQTLKLTVTVKLLRCTYLDETLERRDRILKVRNVWNKGIKIQYCKCFCKGILLDVTAQMSKNIEKVSA